MSITRKALAAALLAIGLAATSGTAAHAGGCGNSWTIRHGDTLSGIASYCGTSVGAIMRANPWIHHPSYVKAGWRIAIPAWGYAPPRKYGYVPPRKYGYVPPRRKYGYVPPRRGYGYVPPRRGYGYVPPRNNYGSGYVPHRPGAGAGYY